MPLARLEEWKGRIIAYFGGGGIAAYSDQVAANTQEAVEVVATQTFFTPQFFTGLGLFFVGCRFIFDVFVYFDKRRLQRQEQEAE